MMAALCIPVFGNDVEVAPGVFDEAASSRNPNVKSIQVADIFGALIVGTLSFCSIMPEAMRVMKDQLRAWLANSLCLSM